MKTSEMLLDSSLSTVSVHFLFSCLQYNFDYNRVTQTIQAQPLNELPHRYLTGKQGDNNVGKEKR